MPNTTAYCTVSDIQNRLSADGVTYRTDDTPPTTYGDVIDEASREIDLYCIQHYSETDMSTNRWVKHAAATIAAFLLCERRGNPPPVGIASKYERLIERLERIRLGQMRIPGLQPRRTDVPTLSQPRIRLDPHPRTVIEEKRGSTRNKPEDYSQQTDGLEWFDPGMGI